MTQDTNEKWPKDSLAVVALALAGLFLPSSPVEWVWCVIGLEACLRVRGRSGDISGWAALSSEKVEAETTRST